MPTCFECGGERPMNTLFCSDKCRTNHFREHNNRNSKAFWNNHKEIVKWDKEYYIVPKFVGTVVEITYEQYKGDIYDFKLPDDNDITKADMDKFIRNISKIIWNYFIDAKIFLPMTIRVDDEGKCHLLMFNSNTGMHTTNKILKQGEVVIVDKNYKKEW